MARTSKIPPALHALVLKEAGDGRTGDEIAQVLWRDHAVETSERAVLRLLERYRSERAEAARVVVQDELRQYLRPAVRRLASIATRAARMERLARARSQELRQTHQQHPLAVAEDLLALKAMDRAMRASDRLLHFAGLSAAEKPGKPDAPTETPKDIRERLEKRIREIIKQLEEKKTPEPEADPEKKAIDEPSVH